MQKRVHAKVAISTAYIISVTRRNVPASEL
jgi:hypothetical protein